MRPGNFLFTSESVTPGHPDKICDQISDAVLDEALKQDPDSRVACESFVTTDFLLVGGEITSKAKLNIENIARGVIRDIGYTDDKIGFDFRTCQILDKAHEQSPDISQGVTERSDKEQGAGDQGLVFGYACNETDVLMPLPIYLAHKLTEKLMQARKDGTLPWLRPDGKSQVTIEYENGKPKSIHTIVIAAQHEENMDQETVRREIIEKVVKPILPQRYCNGPIKYFINRTGKFVVGGPHGDSGLTGRKIIVDTYGGMGAHGGGAFSGKDASKVDRSASYMARYIAKNIVASGLAGACEIQISYVIGEADPVSVMVNTYGTGKIPDSKLTEIVRKVFPLKPKGIIEHLSLKRPIFRKTAVNGHFGREDPDFTWEKTDMAERLRKEASVRVTN